MNLDLNEKDNCKWKWIKTFLLPSVRANAKRINIMKPQEVNLPFVGCSVKVVVRNNC